MNEWEPAKLEASPDQGVGALARAKVSVAEVIERLTLAVSVGAAGVPVVGGPIATAIQGGMTKRRFDRIEGFLVDLSERMEELVAAGAVSPDAAVLGEDEAFEEMFVDLLASVGVEASQTKRLLYRDFLAHVIANGESPDFRLTQARTALAQIDLSHLAVLRGLRGAQRDNKKPFREQPYFQDALNVFAGEGGVWDDEVESVLTDLVAWGLIRDDGDRTVDNQIDYRLTQRGFYLLEYISEDFEGLE